MSTIKIKRVLLDHVSGANDLAKNVLTELSEVNSAPHPALTLSIITGRTALNYIAYYSTAPAGFMSMHATYGQDESSVDYLYVDPAYRGRKIGAKLLVLAVQNAHKVGAKKLWLSPSEETLVPYYEDNGFTAQYIGCELFMEKLI